MATTPKPYNGGQWTESRFHSFVKGALRNASQRWGPKAAVMRAARRDRGVYLCAGYMRRAHKVPLSIKNPGRKATRNVYVDHIEPVVDPVKGFVSWDEVVKRMFVEADGLQVLCRECHDTKTKEERKLRTLSKKQTSS